MKLIKIGMAAVLALAVGACIQSSVQGYADLQAPSGTIHHIAAFVAAPPTVAPGVLAAIRSEAGRRGFTAEDIQSFLPPTRQYTAEQVKQALATHQIDAVLVVSLGDSGIQSQYLGTFISGTSTGTVAATGTAVQTSPFTSLAVAGTTTSSGYATATPMFRPTRATTFQARLIEAKTGRTLWVGRGETDSSGWLFVGMNDSKSISSIFNDLQLKHIISPTPI